VVVMVDGDSDDSYLFPLNSCFVLPPINFMLCLFYSSPLFFFLILFYLVFVLLLENGGLICVGEDG
jgi:hypothetical protein